MRACLFGTYNRQHSANRIYAAAVRAAGYELDECHEPLWERTRDKGAGYFAPLSLVALGLRWLVAAYRLARRWRASGGAGVAIIGFNGHLDIFLLRLLSPRYGPRVVFAPLVSLTETLVDDRRVYRAGSPAARLLAAADRLSCRLADVVVVDTEEHRRYFVERLGVDASRVLVCHLGVDNAAFGGDGETGAADPGDDRADASEPDREIEVLYFGQYLPLHGLDVVVDAVGRLAAREDLRFVFVGTGPERARVEGRLRATGARVQFESWVPYEGLGARIAAADIVLGIFGSSVKARMVVPNKVYEAAAMGRAVVSADTVALCEVFEPEREVLACRADGASLAAAIARMADDPALRRRLGAAAADLMRSRFSDEELGRLWSLPLAGSDGLELGARPRPSVGIAVVNFNDAAATLGCLRSLADSEYSNARVLVVDSGSAAADRRVLADGLAGAPQVETLFLEANLGYAGANNAAMAHLFAAGCEYVLVLNNDTEVTPQAVGALVAAAERHPDCGPVGPRVAAERPGLRAASVGERCWRPFAWLPRSLVRHRRRRQRSYPTGGVMGCAFLVSRSLYERLGGFDERYFAYYEEVDYCLRARAAGALPRVEPMAEIAHRGHRGFGSGMTPVAAYLKARNLWRLGTDGPSVAGRLVLACGYLGLLAASASGYALRGRFDIARALVAGARAGLAGESGEPPSALFTASGYPVAEASA